MWERFQGGGRVSSLTGSTQRRVQGGEKCVLFWDRGTQWLRSKPSAWCEVQLCYLLLTLVSPWSLLLRTVLKPWSTQLLSRVLLCLACGPLQGGLAGDIPEGGAEGGGTHHTKVWRTQGGIWMHSTSMDFGLKHSLFEKLHFPKSVSTFRKSQGATRAQMEGLGLLLFPSCQASGTGTEFQLSLAGPQ